MITAIVGEDQLSLAIGRNGQNVRLASQLIGWQIDLYGSREWLERGADLSLFVEEDEDGFETADFPLSELDLPEEALVALAGAEYQTFLQIIDMVKVDFMNIDGLTEAHVDQIMTLIDELTIVDEAEGGVGAGQAGDSKEAAESESSEAGEVEGSEDAGAEGSDEEE